MALAQMSPMLQSAPLKGQQQFRPALAVGRCARLRSVVCRAEQRSQASAAQQLLQKCATTLLAAAVTALPISVVDLQVPPPAIAKLTAGDPIKNAQAILRNALPIDNKPIRQIQKNLESITESVRIPGKSLGPISRAVRGSQSILGGQKAAIIAGFAPEKKEHGVAKLAELETALADLQATVDGGDKQGVPVKQRTVLLLVGEVESDMIKGFPFQVPAEYADRPQLLGRATLEMKVNGVETPQGYKDLKFTIVCDGFNAPLSAGNFVDLTLRKFYDGMEIQRSDGFVVQTGDPDGPADGYVDPKTKEIRRVPIEIRVVGDKEPVYELSLEDLGRFNEQPVLTFDAYGTLAMARSEFENNSASSQVFFLLKESELTPSGANLLDGRYAVFGYVVEGQDDLGLLKVGDKIEYVKVLDGAQALVNGPSGSGSDASVVQVAEPTEAPAAAEPAPAEV